MFTIDERDRVRRRLLDLAAADPAIVGAAIIGSYVRGASDEWSDIDLAFGVGDVQTALSRWTELIYRDFAALHHWDLPVGATVYRVFLLPDCLEVDIAFAPAAEFGARGPTWQLIFGEPVDMPPGRTPDPRELIGLAWHHVLHARTCIERGLPWQAEWLISGIRDHVLALACLRLGYPTSYAKGADKLPPDITEPVTATLVRSLDEAELRRALAAAAEAYLAELARVDPPLATRLQSTIQAVTSTRVRD